MAAKRGRLEAYFTIPAGVTITFDDSAAAAQVVTITPGSYTPTSLTAFLVATVAGGGHWSITLSKGEAGTGKLTIDTSDRPFSVTWVNATIRAFMGFAADISAVSAAQTGTYQHRGMWLPDCEKWTAHGDDDGNGSAFVRIAAISDLVTPQGLVQSVVGTSYYEARGIRWPGVSRARTKKIAETVTGESFETFWADSQLGDHAYFSAPRSRIAIYWDADASTLTAGRLVGMTEFDPGRLAENWVGRYTVILPRFVLG